MLKAIFSFVIMFVFFFVGIYVVYSMKKEEKVALRKVITYASLCAVLSIATLALIVKLF